MPSMVATKTTPCWEKAVTIRLMAVLTPTRLPEETAVTPSSYAKAMAHPALSLPTGLLILKTALTVLVWTAV